MPPPRGGFFYGASGMARKAFGVIAYVEHCDSDHPPKFRHTLHHESQYLEEQSHVGSVLDKAQYDQSRTG